MTVAAGSVRLTDSRRLRTVAAPPQTLEALVKNELRGLVSELVERAVRELVYEILNGAAPAPVEAKTAASANGATATPSTKLCRSCGREKPADEFAKGRRVCKPCRREQGRSWEERRVARRREHRTAAEPGGEEPPRSGAAESGL